MTDNEWWGPDLTQPRGPDQEYPLSELLPVWGKRYGRAFKGLMAGFGSASHAIVEASRGIHTHTLGPSGVFDMPLSWTGQRYKKRKLPDSPACHIEYPTSLEPWIPPKQPKINTHVPKMRYRNRR